MDVRISEACLILYVGRKRGEDPVIQGTRARCTPVRTREAWIPRWGCSAHTTEISRKRSDHLADSCL